MNIPGLFLSILTFPGVIIHTLAHQVFCMLLGIPVYEVKYFQLKNPCGYVVHGPADTRAKAFLIVMGPFFVLTILGVLMVLPVSIQLLLFHSVKNPLELAAGWLGISLLLHALPFLNTKSRKRM